MKVWRLGAAVLLAAWVAGCGGNSTPVGISITPLGSAVSPVPVGIGAARLFFASVTGSSTSSVTWQVCLPGVTPTSLPTSCSPNGTKQTVLSGYGTISPLGLYQAPLTVPQPDAFVIVATSTVDTTVFAVSHVTIDSGVRVRVEPASVSIGTMETLQFTATVTGTTNTAVAWTVTSGSNVIAGGNSTVGTISPSGFYTAPAVSPGTVTLTATSAVDPSRSGTATVGISNASDPTLTSIDPTTASQGSIQQDIYVIGTNFFSTSTVIAGGVPLPTVFINGTALRATIPSSQLRGASPPPAIIPIQVQRQNGDISQTANLTVEAVRPAVVASSPDSLTQNGSGLDVDLTGGFFTPVATGAQFNSQPRIVSLTNSRQMKVTLLPADLATPGLYPVVVRNQNVAPPAASISAVNIAVAPAATSIPTGALSTITVGKKPSAIAINPVTAKAVVANTNDGTVSVIDLASNTVTATITVGSKPTGVAIDELLTPPLALVVNSGDNTISVINLNTNSVTQTVSLAQFTPPGSAPFTIGINPLTHRAFVANQSTNQGTVIDLINPNPTLTPPCTTPPCPALPVGGNLTPYSTGLNPSVAIDPRLNWAIVTPGGAGTINFVDLGRPASPGDGGRTPLAFASYLLSPTVQGVGVNTETHQLLLADPNGPDGAVAEPSISTFSLLDNSPTAVNFPTTQLGFVAAAVDSLSNVGLAVNTNSNSATVVDLKTGLVLQTVAVGSSPQAVAVDSASGEAFVVNQGDGSSNGNVSVVSLGPVRQLHILEASPAVAFTPLSVPLPLTITGHGFVANSQVLLDGTPLPSAAVTFVSARQLVATIPVSMLTSPRRFIVTVNNPTGTAPDLLSNATDLTIIQQVVVGTSPFGVAVDTDRDLAVVTNSGDGTVSIVDLTTGTTTGAPILVGTTPQGVGVIPRLGLAVVANNGSNNFSIVDDTLTVGPKTLAICPSCSLPVAVGVNPDAGTAAVTNTLAGSNGTPSGNVTFVNAANATTGLNATVDSNPIAVAMDPTLNLAGVATASQASSFDVVDPLALVIQNRISGLSVPSGVIFDSVNQVFVVANSSGNFLVSVDPVTFGTHVFRGGITPSSLDYNFQTATIVTVNSASNTMSVLDYLCPPDLTITSCPQPRVRAILAFSGSQPFSTLLQFAVAVDPRLNLAVVVDIANNRLLLVPLPH